MWVRFLLGVQGVKKNSICTVFSLVRRSDISTILNVETSESGEEVLRSAT